MLISAKYEDSKLVTKDKFIVSVKLHEYYGDKSAQYSILVDKGKNPSVGELQGMLETGLGFSMKLTALSPFIEYKPVNPESKGLRMATIFRISKDHTYKPITRI